MKISINAQRDYCERICRFASNAGARIHETKTESRYQFTFILPGSRMIPGSPQQHRTEALTFACQAYADAGL